jgi:hypothetical protein
VFPQALISPVVSRIGLGEFFFPRSSLRASGVRGISSHARQSIFDNLVVFLFGFSQRKTVRMAIPATKYGEGLPQVSFLQRSVLMCAWYGLPVFLIQACKLDLAINPCDVAQATSCGKRQNKLKGLILAQNERWRRGLGMQVERESQQWEDSGVRDSNV